MSVLFWLLIGLAVIDFEHLLLPNVFTIPGIALGFLMRLAPYHGKTNQWLDCLRDAILPAAGLLFIALLYKSIRKRDGMGMGDVKLAAMLGIWLGLAGVLLAIFLGVITAALYALSPLIRQKTRPLPWKQQQLPLGTFLCLGGVYAAIWGNATIQWYLELFS